MESLHDLLKNNVTTMREAADLVPRLVYFFREKIKKIRETEEICCIHIPFDIYDMIFTYMCYSDDFEKEESWELKRAGNVGNLDGMPFKVRLDRQICDQFSDYLYYELEDGTKKVLE